MTFTKRKKNSRYRASQTHGWGAKKKHRGSGNKGGCGNAGSGKRGDSKKPSNWKDPDYFGKIGFVRRRVAANLNKINLDVMVTKLRLLKSKGFAEEKDGSYEIDLKKAGYDKLLGTGKIKGKFVVHVDYASKNAVEKIEALGGKIMLLKVKAPAKSKKGSAEADVAE